MGWVIGGDEIDQDIQLNGIGVIFFFQAGQGKGPQQGFFNFPDVGWPDVGRWIQAIVGRDP